MNKYFTFSSWLMLLQKLGKEKQKIFSPQTLARATGLSLAATQKAIQRLIQHNQLIKLYKNAYTSRLTPPSMEEIAMFYGKPCYISFESALETHGIISQAPQVLTCATTRKLKNLKTPLGEIIFHHLLPRLFNHFENDRGILRATAEKALLDYLYIHRKNKGLSPPLDEFDLIALNKKKLKKLAKDFPRKTSIELKALEKRLG